MNQQTHLFRHNRNSSYGGELQKTRKGRSHGRPLASKKSMHLVLRSSKAKGLWSFNAPKNKKNIQNILEKFSQKYAVKIISKAFVGNHLHFHIQLRNRHSYFPFIRAVTSAITMTVTGASRWKPLRKMIKGKFWDHRPFTRIVNGIQDFMRLSEYIEVNQLEGCGYTRSQARYILAREWDLQYNSS